jgi:hypothetical protein
VKTAVGGDIVIDLVAWEVKRGARMAGSVEGDDARSFWQRGSSRFERAEGGDGR